MRGRSRCAFFEDRSVAEGIIIREVKPEDVETMAGIAKAAWTPVFAHRRKLVGDEVFEANWPDALENKATQVRRACSDESTAEVRVAELDGRAVGFITFYLNVKPGEGEIGNNAVHPDFQGRGIAQRMYAHAFDAMRAAGMALCKVATGLDDAHIPARRAYEKAGFDMSLPTLTYYRKL